MKGKRHLILFLAAGLLLCLPLPGLSASQGPWTAAELKLPENFLPFVGRDLSDIWQAEGETPFREFFEVDKLDPPPEAAETVPDAVQGDTAAPEAAGEGSATADASAIETDTGQAFRLGFFAQADLTGIHLTDADGRRTRQLALPAPAGPGRDIQPLVYLPWQLSISPDGSHLLLVTAEGYADQETDYFRLWVLDLEGHVENCLESPGLISALWFSQETISCILYDDEDPTLSAGTLCFWNWRKSTDT